MTEIVFDFGYCGSIKLAGLLRRASATRPPTMFLGAAFLITRKGYLLSEDKMF
jgi:hypothetical protein